MATDARELSTARIMIGWASVVGIALVTMVIIIGDNDFARATSLFVIMASPFWLALASVLLPLSIGYRRLLWLISGIGALVAGLLALFSGIGLFLIGISMLYQWAAFRIR